jgi:hypothetical protein
MCTATIENAIFFLDAFVASTMESGSELALSDFQVRLDIILWKRLVFKEAFDCANLTSLVCCAVNRDGLHPCQL